MLDLLFLRYHNFALIKTQTISRAEYVKVKASILYVVEQWIKLHPEDWTQIKNKKCRQIVKKTLAVSNIRPTCGSNLFKFCKRTRPESRSLEQQTKANLQRAKELRQAEKAEENNSLEMDIAPTVEDIDRTSINGKAAEIFLNRISVKDIG